MRILPITNYNYQAKYRKSNNIQHDNIERNSVQKFSNVTFTSTAKFAEPLRTMLHFDIPDAYSRIILLNPEILNGMFADELFYNGIFSIAKRLDDIKKSLFPVELEFYKLLKMKGMQKPNMPLKTFINSLVPKHRNLLLKEQKPIIDSIKSYSDNLPHPLSDDLNYLLYITEEKLNDRPIITPFNIDEFCIALKNIKKRILNTANYDGEEDAIRNLESRAGNLKATSLKLEFSSSSGYKKYHDEQKRIISNFCKYLIKSPLKNDIDLLNLSQRALAQIYEYPIKIKFGRKTFIKELLNITQNIENRKLAHKIDNLAISLPTSKQNLSAFIMKAESRSEDQIGYDLLSDSEGSVDHILAKSKEGKHNLFNYILVSKRMNVDKSHEAFKVFYKRHPEILGYTQNQIDRYIYLANNTNILHDAELPISYINSIARTLEKLSKDPNFILDTSKLRN